MVIWLQFIALLPLVVAFPYKRFDNYTSVESDFGTDYSSSAPYYNTTTTTTVDAYTTVYLPTTTLVIPTTATSQLSIVSSYIEEEGFSTFTTVVTSYETITSDGIVTSIPVTTMESYSVTKPTVAAEINEDDGVVTVTVTETETETETETVTVTETETDIEDDDLVTYSTLFLTSTLTTSYPITAEFTSDSLITTLTSFVEVTTTQTYTTETEIPVPTSEGADVSSLANSFTFSGYNTTVY